MTVPLRTTGGVVLAGGKSRRLGRDKAGILFRGTPLLHHALDLLRPVVEQLLIAADRVDRYQVRGAMTIADPLPDCGPLGGILGALEQFRDGSVLVLACDLPMVTPELLAMLVRAEPEATVVIPCSSGCVQPLCGRYHVSVRGDLRQALEKGERRVMHFIRSQQHTCIDIPPGHPLFTPQLLHNVNTEADIRPGDG